MFFIENYRLRLINNLIFPTLIAIPYLTPGIPETKLTLSSTSGTIVTRGLTNPLTYHLHGGEKSQIALTPRGTLWNLSLIVKSYDILWDSFYNTIM